MRDVRVAHTATLLPSGHVLVAGGSTQTQPATASAEIYDPLTGRWTLTGSLATPREEHSATLLPSGKVLVTGGRVPFGNELASAEVYDPATGVWTPAGAMATPRGGHTAVLLPSGKVLVAGGDHGGIYLSSTEIYDPVAGTWSPATPMQRAHSGHTATRLLSGKILVAGGWPFESTWTTEIYDPATGSWSLAGSFGDGRYSHSATLLPSGKVLVTGGYGHSQILASTEIYDPEIDIWLTTSPLASVRTLHSAVLLPSGQVLVVGGSRGSFFAVADAEIFDPATQTWTVAGSPPFPSWAHTATVLANGSVLVAGGFEFAGQFSGTQLYRPDDGSWSFVDSMSAASVPDLVPLADGSVLAFGATLELFDPATRTWSPIDPPAVWLGFAAKALLPSGKVLMAGGRDGNFQMLTNVELFDPQTRTWSPTGSLVTGRSGATATPLPSGKVLVAGGWGGQNVLAGAELYDPATGTWQETAPMSVPRQDHSATLLPSGEVLVAGGIEGQVDVHDTAEIYDPGTETWRATGLLPRPRAGHSATLLPSGKVLVVGGIFLYSGFGETAELYDPATGTWSATGSLIDPRPGSPSATLLQSGRVLVAGGRPADPTSVELYDPATGVWERGAPLGFQRGFTATALLPTGEVLAAGGYTAPYYTASSEVYSPASPPPAERRPVILWASEEIEYGLPLYVTGTGFSGDSDASHGGTRSSPSNIPILHLRSLIDQRQVWLAPDPRLSWWGPMTLTVSDLPPSLDPGPYFLSVVVAGVPSEPRRIDVRCSVEITGQPEEVVVVPLNGTATVSVETQGARRFQWSRDGIEIPGATGPSYTTPPASPGDSGSLYRVTVDSGCMSEVSDPAVLSVADSVPPDVSVVSPSGGEYWTLSSPDAPSDEIVTWSMTDDIRICRVEVRLLFSSNGGQTYQPVPDPAGGVLLTAGPGGTCRFVEQPSVTSLSYEVPASPPSGAPGSLYRIEVRVTDHAGLTTTARSANPFFIVQPNPDTVRTLILSNLQRMRTIQGLSQDQADALATKLRELAGHPRVQGLVVDLASVTSLAPFYQSWDAEPTDPDRANAVLFAPGGLHEYLRSELLPTYTGVRHVVLVGDDRTIPFARVPDRTGLRESAYLAGGDLTAAGTVGAALAADRYLSDDLLATRGSIDLPLTADQRERGAFLPDLAVGRLVENPEEIVTAIATFISQDGVLDLQALHPSTGHKVLVTGYDFLIDSGRRIRRRWKDALDLPLPHEDDDLEPVDGRLLTPDWGEASVADRRNVLRQHLAGNGGDRYGIASLNGHANHHQEGVPGAGVTDIQGLGATEIFGPNTCGGGSALTLGGAVIYSTGCHGGLPVAGSCSTDADHSLDLAQTFLARGVQAYVGNTGYGWGLMEGVGYGERLVEIFTEELTAGGTVAVGDAVLRAKRRYFLELPRFDDYDEKTLLQWTLFGLPMYAVRTGIVSTPGVSSVSAHVLESRRDTPATGQVGPVGVKSRIEAAVSLPPHLTQLNAHFDFSAPGVYTKYDALGNPLPEGTLGCPAPPPGGAAGCYYTLNSLAGGGTGSSDLPIQPYFLYDSRLSGTSQHGALWMGGTYTEESGWVPVIAELVSNGGDFSNNGSTPWMIKHRPRPIYRPTGDDELTCRPSDLEASTLVVVTGESLKAGDSDPGYSRQRVYRGIDLEVLYFNDRGQGGNCDRSGPELGSPIFGGDYHRLTGGNIEWAVPASDEAGVWRVVAVYDLGPDGDGQGAWSPFELTNDGSGTWRGSLTTAGLSRLTYFLQAVDRRGNVSWLDFDTIDLPASGVPHDLPLPVEVIVPPVNGCYTLSLARNTSSGGGLPTASPPSSGSCATGQYVAGTPITITAAPNAGWSVGNWSGTDNDTSTLTTNSVTMPAGSHTVTVNYSQPASPGPGLSFYTVTPCRLADTRQTPAPLASGVTRTLPVAGVCGIPPGAQAVSLNATAVGGAAGGHITLFPADQSEPSTSTINFKAGQTRANNVVLRLSPSGHLAARATLVGSSVHLILDVNGYFAETQP